MNVNQVYEQAIKPLSSKEKLTIARLILNEFESQSSQAGFEYLKQRLPQIERISFSEQDIGSV